MGDHVRGQLDLDDEDRLPWLEPAVDDDGDDRISPLRLLGVMLIGLLLIGAVVAAVWWVQNHDRKDASEGELILAPDGDYKVAANEADARKFEGEGDASFAASEGVARDGRIDTGRVPEAPITATMPDAVARPAASSRPGQSVTARVTDQTAPKAAIVAPRPAAGSAMIQLGAYGSQSGASDAWSRLSRRYAYLAPLPMSVEQAQVGGGTVYRLRAAAGAQASALCGKLKVAGESCLVVN